MTHFSVREVANFSTTRYNNFFLRYIFTPVSLLRSRERYELLRWVCLLVCLVSALISQKPHYTAEFCGHVVCGRGSVLLWRRCSTLQYVTHFRFCGWPYVFTRNGRSGSSGVFLGAESVTVPTIFCLKLKMISKNVLCVAHLGRNLLFTIAMLSLWSAPIEERSIVISLSVCLSVCSHAYLHPSTCPNFAKFYVHVACGCDSIIFWRRCNTLCTSGFVDDVTFSQWHVAVHVSDATVAALPQCRARPDTSASWCWMRPGLENVGCQD